MTPYFKIQNVCWMLLLTFLSTSLSVAQRDVEIWKLQLAVGVNNPIDNRKKEGYFTKYINFPTVNIGLQRMFSENLGAKLDLGYNRASEAPRSFPFKLNYTRVNAQLVYDFKDLITFFPSQIGVVGHAGPGISMTKPLGDFTDNTYTYLNLMGGLEFHYRVSESFSFFVDGSYAISPLPKDKYDLSTDGYSFNGDLMYVVFGMSFSLSGCHYC